MAGPILTSSPHYFSAVKILLCLFSEKLAGSGYQTKDPQITLPIWTNKLCTTSLRGKDSIFYMNQWTRDIHVLSRQMSHVNKAQAYTHWPTGCPNRARKTQAYMDPSYKWILGPVSMKAHRREQAYPSSKQAQMLEWPHCHFVPFLTPSSI